jgi:Cu2+-exporting ATPase
MRADLSAAWPQRRLAAPGVLAPGVAAALDDEAALAGSTRWRTREDGGREGETLFAIEGIYCAACAGIIESALRVVPGVAQAEVNAASRRLQVRWDPQRIAARRAVQRAGYRAPAQLRDAHSALRRRRAPPCGACSSPAFA